MAMPKKLSMQQLEDRITPTVIPFTEVEITENVDIPEEVVAIDLDRDGDMDILSASRNDTRVAWYQNNGFGTFTQINIDIAAGDVQGLTAADMDQDGDIDVIAAAPNTDELTIYFNNGSQVFTKFTADSLAGGPIDVQPIDMDQDGDMDLVVALVNNDDFVWYENFSGAFVLQTIENNADGARSVRPVDIDRDGDIDVVGAAANDGDIFVYKNDGNQNFTRENVDLNVNTVREINTADVDGDGDQDILAAVQNTDRVYWYENIDGNGTFNAATNRFTITTELSRPQSVQGVDMDRDGDIDVLSAGRDNNLLSWFENDGSQTFTRRDISANAKGVESVYAADMDRDGDIDAIAAEAGTNEIGFYRNDTIHRSAYYPTGKDVTTTVQNPRSVASGDLNNNGFTDLAVGSFTDNTIRWYANDGMGNYTEQSVAVSSSALQVEEIGIADVNHDGILDIYAGLGNRVVWYQNDGSGNFTEQFVAAINGSTSIDAGDFNRDGTLDFVSVETVTGKVQLYLSDGVGGYDPAITPLNADFDSTIARFVDVNRDGLLDIVTDDPTFTQNVFYYRQDLSGGFDAAKTIGSVTGVRDIRVGDAGRDGDIDVFVASFTDNAVYAFINDGTETFTRQTAVANAQGAVAIATGDADQDGDLDLFAGAFTNGSAYYAQYSAPAFFQELVSNQIAGVNDVHVTDTDGDGDLDLVLTAGNQGSSTPRIVIYENKGGQFSLQTTDIAPPTITPGSKAAVLSIEAQHRGRFGDSQIELVTFEFLIDDGFGTPLTSTQANNIIENLYIYRDANDNGTYEGGVDTKVATVSTLSLVGGKQVVTFNDGDPNVTLAAPGGDFEGTFFVVPQVTGSADTQTPNTFSITHLTESSSTAEDAVNDIPLSLEFFPNTTSSTVSTFIDTIPPQPPTVTAFANDSGTLGDGITNDTTLTVSGMAEPNSTVEVFRNGTSIGTTMATSTGTWSYDDTTTLNETTYQYTATATDASGNSSTPSAPLTVMIDSTPPTAPVVTGISNDTGTPGDGITSDRTLMVMGTAEPNAMVEVFLDGASIGTTTADSTGAWTYDYTATPLGAGTYQLTAQAMDVAGNTSDLSSPFTVMVQLAPLDVTLTAIFDDTGSSSTDRITRDNTLSIQGITDPNLSVELFLDGTSIGMTTSDASGNFTYDFTATPLSDGSYQFTAIASNGTQTGSISNSMTVIIDTTSPRVTVDSQTTESAMPTLTGTVNDPDAIIQVTVNGQTFTATNNGDGTWSLSGSNLTPLPNGTFDVQVQSTDVAGNTGTDTSTNELVVQSTITPPLSSRPSRFSVGAGVGGSSQVTVYSPTGDAEFQVNAFPGFMGGVRTAIGDINNDGIDDVIVGTGPGRATQVRVIDGATQQQLFTIDPFEASFTGGVYVAAGDVNGDGFADIIITPDEGGGPRVRVFSGKDFSQLADFFGIDDPNFRGGARASVGDMNNDGIGDVIVVAGFGGGPRVAAFDGKSLTPNGGPKLFGDFLAFEPQLRNGIFVAVGDTNGDGFAELIAGGGPGGGPRVSVFDGKSLITSGQQTRNADFFAGDLNNRGGVRLAAKDLDGDGRTDVIAGAGSDAGSRIAAYNGTSLGGNSPSEMFGFEAFPGFTNGVFVG